MAEPVKNLVMQALAAVLATVEGIASVQLEAELPFDLDDIPEVQRPALYVWDDSDDPEPANLMTRHDLAVMLALFMPLNQILDEAGQPTDQTDFPAFAIEAETLAARIHNKLAVPAVLATLRAAGIIDLELGDCRKAKASGTWGEMILPLRGEYVHAAADAFSLSLS